MGNYYIEESEYNRAKSAKYVLAKVLVLSKVVR